MQFANPTAGGRIQGESEQWDGTSIIVTRGCAAHQATGQGCAVDLGDRRCDRPVLAVAAGTVTFRDPVQGIVRIAHAGGWQSDYAHMSPLLVSVGQQVAQGQQIGEIGDAHDPAVTNFSGCHLHFGLLLNGVEQDPWPYLNATLEGDMSTGFKQAGTPIGTFTFTADHDLISPLDLAVRYPRPSGTSFDVIAALDLKTPDGTPVDLGGISPPRNNWDQVYLVDAPAFGIAAYALRSDGTFMPRPVVTVTPSAGFTQADVDKAVADALATIPPLPTPTVDVAGALAALNAMSTYTNRIATARAEVVRLKNAAKLKLTGG